MVTNDDSKYTTDLSGKDDTKIEDSSKVRKEATDEQKLSDTLRADIDTNFKFLVKEGFTPTQAEAIQTLVQESINAGYVQSCVV
jgi:hypothetical protein